MPLAITAGGAIFAYLVEDTHHALLQHITKISVIPQEDFLMMDGFTLRNLEILYPSNPQGKSLLDIIDKTSTPMGGRLLRACACAVLCANGSIGRNFADHAKELNNAVPTEPFFFLKPTSSYIGNGDSILVPQGVEAHHEGARACADRFSKTSRARRCHRP